MKTPASKHSKKKQNKTKQNKNNNKMFCFVCFFFAVVLFQQYPNANIADYSADPGTLR